MTDAFDVAGARAAGYTDNEIAGHLASSRGFDLKGALDSGYTPSDVIDHLMPAPEKPPTFVDYAKATASGAASGLGMIAQGGGELVSRGVNAVAGTELRSINPLQGAIDWLNESQTPGAKKAVADTQISGDITSPSTWDFGKDPTVRGLALQGFNAIGQFAPNLAIAVATAGASIPAQVAIGATVGGLQGLGGGAEEERHTYMAMSHQDLTAKSALYRELIAKGVNPEVAKNAVAEAGALGGGLGNAIPSAAEGAFENFLIGAITKGKFKIPSIGAGVVGKAAGGAVGGGLMGGSEEALEQATQNIGSNIAVGGNRPIGEGTLQQFVMGMIAEGVVGGGGGVYQHLTQPTSAKPAQPGAEPLPLSVPATDPVHAIATAQTVDEAIAAAERALNTTPEDSAAFNQSMVPTGLLSEAPPAPAEPFRFDPAVQGQQVPDTAEFQRPPAPAEAQAIALPGEPAAPTQIPPSTSTREQYAEALVKSQRGELLTAYERTLLDNPPETPAIALPEWAKPRQNAPEIPPTSGVPNKAVEIAALKGAPHPFDATQAVAAPTAQAQNVADGQAPLGNARAVEGDGVPRAASPVEPVRGSDAARRIESAAVASPEAVRPEGGPGAGVPEPAAQVAPQFKDYTAPKADKAKGVIKGEIRTFKTERGATLFARANKLTGYKARESEGRWILSKPVLQRSEAQQANDAALSRERTTVRPHDSLATVMGKMGGLKLSDITSDGFHPKDAKLIRSGVFGKPALRAQGGISLDAMAELAAQHGFDVLDEAGRPDASRMRDLIDRMLEGQQVYSPEGHEYHAAKADEVAADQARAEALPDEAAIEESGYNSLSEPERAVVDSVFDEDLTDALFEGKGGQTYDSAEDAFPRDEAPAREATPLATLPGEPEARGGGREETPPAKPAAEVAPLAVPAASLYVEFGGRRHPVADVVDAQRKWVDFRDEAMKQGGGVRDVGNGIKVSDAEGNVVATISYNGTVRSPDGREMKSAAEARALTKPKPQETPADAGVSTSGDANERLVAAADAIARGEEVSPETLAEFPSLAELAKAKTSFTAARAAPALELNGETGDQGVRFARSSAQLSDRVLELLKRYKVDNPFALKAARARERYEQLSGRRSAHDEGMANAFPLGAGFGRAGGERRIESTINRAVEVVEARKNADYLDAQATAFDAGKINAQGRRWSQEQEARSEKRATAKESREERVAAAKAIVGDKPKWQVPRAVWADSTNYMGGSGRALIESGHREAVEGALAEGKDVPAEVMADYPDLASLHGETEAQIKAREAQEKAAADEKAKIANAPSEKDFTLTGSNRRVDVAEAHGQKPLFSRNETPEGGFSIPSVRSIIEPIVATWTNPPNVNIITSMAEAPPSVRQADQQQLAQGADGRPFAFFHGGEVYLVASEIKTAAQAIEGLYHESLGHYGLRGVYGDALNSVLDQIAVARRPEVAAKAKQYGLDPLKREDRATAAEEVLAEMAQTHPELGYVRQAVAAIRNWLRDHGIGLKWSDDDIIQKFILPARNWVERGHGKSSSEQETTFHREVQAIFSRPIRSEGLPRDVHVIASLDNHFALRNVAGYLAGKRDGDMEAALRAVRSVVSIEDLKSASASFGSDVTYLAATAPEAGGDNVLPHALAHYYAEATGARADGESIVQVNRAHHTGAGKLERLVSRPLFEGPVERGRRYVLVDDVVTRGGTIAELADHIRSLGGEVVGVVALAKATGSGTLAPSPAHIRAIKESPGLLDVTRRIFRVEPDALTHDEAEYISSHGDAAALRDRALAAARARGVEIGESAPVEGPSSEGVGPTFARTGFTKNPTGWVADQSQEMQETLRKAGAWRPQVPLKQRMVGWTAGWQTKLKQGMVDQFDPIKSLDYHAYMLSRMSKSSAGPLETTLLDGTIFMDKDGAVDVNYEKGGFVGRMQKLQGEHDRFFSWVIGNRAERLMAEGKEHNFTADDIARLKTLNRGKMPDGKSREALYVQALADLNRYNKAILDMAEKAGLIDAETRPLWEKEFYIPFYRMTEGDQVKGPRPKAGLVRQYAFKTLKGGAEAIGDPMENILKNWAHLIDASMKNNAARASILAAARAGVAIEAKEEDARQMARAMGKKDTVVYFSDEGRERYFVIDDPFVLDAVNSLTFTGFSGPAMKLMGTFKHWLTYGVTISPTFRIRNVLRDSIAMIGANPASYNVLDNVLTGWKMTEEGSPVYSSMIAGGGVMRYGSFMEGDNGRNVKRLIEEGVDAATILDAPAKTKAMLRAAYDWWMHVGDRSENVNRAALYKKLRDEGKSHLEASYAARDTMDFSMQGTWAAVRFLTQTVPFFNARLQGLYKLGRGAAEDPRRFAYVIGAASLASVALLLAYKDDDDWKRREDWDRESFWWFKVGDKAFRIPKPFEIGAIGTLAERGVELFATNELTGKQFVQRMGSVVAQQLSMNPVPQLFMPMAEVWANQNTFTNRPIETMGMEKLSPAMRSSPTTSAFAQLAGKNSLVSPVQIDHLISGYFGWLGMHAIATADLALRPAMGAPGKPTPKVDDLFVVGDFVKDLPAYQSKYLTRLYDQGKEVQQLMADLRQLQKTGATEEAAAFLEDHRDKLRLAGVYTSAEAQLTKVNQRIKMIQVRDLDPVIKREQLDLLYQMRNRLAELTERRVQQVTQ